MTPEQRAQRLAQLREKARGLAQQLGIPAEKLPPFGEAGDGRYVDYDGLYRLIARDRGVEVDHRLTLDEDELMYWVFSGITSAMALQYEVEHRVPAQDFRRIWFDHQLKLLEQLNPTWRTRRQHEQREILAQAPYSDP